MFGNDFFEKYFFGNVMQIIPVPSTMLVKRKRPESVVADKPTKRVKLPTPVTEKPVKHTPNVKTKGKQKKLFSMFKKKT